MRAERNGIRMGWRTGRESGYEDVPDLQRKRDGSGSDREGSEQDQDMPDMLWKRNRREMRAKCPLCGRELTVQPPKGGDGSVDVFPRHPPGGKNRCQRSRTIVDREDYVEEKVK